LTRSEFTRSRLYKPKEFILAIETSYSDACARFASLLDEVVLNQEVVIVNRHGKEAVAMIAASELSSLVETAHLLQSPKNARRLLTALEQVQQTKGKSSSLDKLRRDLGLDGYDGDDAI
jgi:antitoxin YefM